MESSYQCFNETHLGNGMQLSLSNDAIDYKGIQVGLFNKSKN